MFSKAKEFIKNKIWIFKFKRKIRNKQITPKGLYFLQYLHGIQEGKDIYIQAYEDYIEGVINLLDRPTYSYQQKREIAIQTCLDILESL